MAEISGQRAVAGMAVPTADSPVRAPRRIHGAPSDEAMQRFVALSVTLTGYDDAELWGTGMVRSYLNFLIGAVGDEVTGILLSKWAELAQAAGSDPNAIERLVRDEVLADSDLGPVARNLIILWYLGQWLQLPADWRDAHGAHAGDHTCVVSPEAYAEGLVWNAIGAHPQGAKMAGYGSWALPPKTREEIP